MNQELAFDFCQIGFFQETTLQSEPKIPEHLAGEDRITAKRIRARLGLFTVYSLSFLEFVESHNRNSQPQNQNHSWIYFL